MLKPKTFLFFTVFLISLLSLTVSDSQSSTDDLPPGVLAELKHGAAVYAVAFSPDGKLIASGGDNNSVILWDVITSERKSKVFTGHNKEVMSVVFSPDGQLLASACLDGFVRVWDVSSGDRRTTLAHNGWVKSVTFSPDAKTLASGGGDREGDIKFWDVNATQNHHITTFPGHRGIVESVVYSPDGQLLVSTSRDKTAKLWDVTDQQMRKTFAKHSKVVHAASFSPDGETFATSSGDSTIILWKVSTEEQLTSFEVIGNRQDYAIALAFSPDGKHLAAACTDYIVRLWNLDNLQRPYVLRGHRQALTSVAFSPDGRMLATGSQDRTVLLWDLSHFNIVPSEPILAPAPISNSEPIPTPISKPEPKPVLVDTTPPNIVILAPTGSIVPPDTEKLTIRGRVTDDSSIGEVKVNGNEIWVSAEGRFDAPVQLTGGENEIRVTVTDLHGNMGTKRFTVERPGPIDNSPPIITLDESIKNRQQSQNSEYTFNGSVTDDNSIGQIQVNGKEVFPSWEGKFTTTVQLVSGENEIRITATDSHGNISTKRLTIFVDNPGPIIVIIKPTILDSQVSTSRGLRPINQTITLKDASTTVFGKVEDEDGVSEVKVNGKKAELRGNDFKATVSLNYGDNSLHFVAKDSLGNLSEKKLLIYRPPPIRNDYALLFAVENYDHWSNLRYPISDAEKIQQNLANIYGFQTELIKNPSKEDIYNTILRYAEKVYDNDDQLFIFFAGHGYFNSSFNEGLLVARDTKLPVSDRTMLSYVSFLRLRDVIDRMSCRHIFLVMDSCYSGTFDSELAMRGFTEVSSKELSQEYIKQISEHTTRRYLTSGQKEQVPDNSKFIGAFISALESNGGDDNILTIDEILRYMNHLDNPKPHSDQFGQNEPGSDFLFIAK